MEPPSDVVLHELQQQVPCPLQPGAVIVVSCSWHSLQQFFMVKQGHDEVCSEAFRNQDADALFAFTVSTQLQQTSFYNMTTIL